ncbi:site-2 protease family protein [Actinomyces gaoshouyii]|uniref:Peptidase n=1 Tax=Actinomyces gaoshouyii TaxID=1960083 RepID=A0A8H9H8I4_9ACTO|nr:site-2 protease family protein [Actinomyces gaoshouyii]GGO97587.1 peptidase [Actinomyces gaoshouyii]
MPSAATRNGEMALGRIGGAPVVVSSTSLLLGLIIAASWYPLVTSALGDAGIVVVLGTVAATVIGVAISILLHELAHGLVGAALGRPPIRYELLLWGGRTSFGPPRRAWSPWRDAVCSLAGPATNALLWIAGRTVLDFGALTTPAIYVALWAITWLNLALAIFNALPGLPLDGGQALASLVAQATGNRGAGLKAAAWGGLAVVAGIAWLYLLQPLLIDHHRPSPTSLILAAMVGWTIGSTSWRILGLGGAQRAAARLDLRSLARPIATLPAAAPLVQVGAALDDGAALALITDGPTILGTIDAAGLAELGVRGEGATAEQACTVLPVAAITTSLTGQEAADALKTARTVSRWLIVVDSGRMIGAVPTGAR